MLKIDRTLLAGTALAFAIGMTAPSLAQQSNPGPASRTSPPVTDQTQTGVPSATGAQGTTQDDATPGSNIAQGQSTQGQSTQGQSTQGQGATGQGTGTQMQTGQSTTANPQLSAMGDKLIGKDLYGADNEKLGEVDNVVMDSNREANSVLVDIGGFLGIGAKRVAIPVAQLRAEGDRLVAQNLTKEQARNMEEYKEPDGSKPGGQKRM